MDDSNQAGSTGFVADPASGPVPRHGPRRWWADPRPWFGLLLAVHLAPLWVFRYFPTQDGPSHLYHARLLRQLGDPANYQVRQYYQINPALHPNSLVHILLAGLELVAPPPVAEKILLSIIVALLPLSMVYLIGSIDRQRSVFGLLGFVFAYHNLLHMGFYNFSLGVSISLFALGFWWRTKDALTVSRLAGLYGLILLTWLAHYFCIVALLLTITVIGLFSLLLKLGRTVRQKLVGELDWAESGRRAGRDLWATVLGYGCLVPVYAWVLDYYLRTSRPEGDNYHRLEDLSRLFWKTLTLATYTDWHLHLTPYLLNLMGACIAVTILFRLARKQWVHERDALLIVVGILWVLYFRLAWWKNQGGWVNDRVYVYLFLLLAVWFVQFPRAVNAVLGAFLVGLSLVHTGRLAYEYHLLQPEFVELGAAADQVPPHSTLSADMGDTAKSEAFLDRLKYVQPFIPMPYFYALGRDVAYFHLYHTSYSYFLIRNGEAPKKDPDYLLVWAPSDSKKPAEKYQKEYEPIHQSERLTLFRRRPVPPNLSIWKEDDNGHKLLRLRMLPAPANLVTDYTPVPKNTLYRPGNYGWLALPPRREWQGAGALPEPHRDAVGDERDRTFRVDLPNGRYRVTVFFAPHRDGRYEVNVVANDQRIARHLVVNSEEKDRQSAYEVEITNGRLDQTFYTTWRKSVDRKRLPFWAVSGIQIESDTGP